eukprot:CAMPEP_0198243198 /NCGR_PEP_ID=MMETSP1446-20131203/25475_1 /TAXON_ID=1461542 ORGANISM="Unidentified sp, Strain CCMP2111" /NCGR_SAMPLE_ID=MMETSP1446 /ASSEMBLY_ACC=CAM_ASM_001112 /LENGTH=37 /DNA_ID= /DNA_START= /DNA_END= /DNA_ORIENTATION=
MPVGWRPLGCFSLKLQPAPSLLRVAQKFLVSLVYWIV